ncbi:hypothetical protein V1477_018731, partial [Vespula maculifrons]
MDVYNSNTVISPKITLVLYF